MARESFLIESLVELTDHLVDDFDVIDVLTVLSNRAVASIDVDAAGVMLAAPGEELQFVASSSESMRVLELFQIQANEGPCVDCFNDGTAIFNYKLDPADSRWPNFTPRALAQGFRAVHCLPLRLRGQTVGALNLFCTAGRELDANDIAAAKILADVATLAVLQHRSALDAQMLHDQLSNALNSRMIVEQAKGKISEALQCDMDQAFDRLRSHAREHRLLLTDVARVVVNNAITSEEVAFIYATSGG